MSGRIKPIIVVGAGPVGLTTALGLDFYGLPFLLFEDDAELSRDTKAGTILTRTIEAFRRYGVADEVLAKALRVDEIGDVERATNIARPSVQTALLGEDTRYPFVINMPQHHLEPILCDAIDRRRPGALHLRHRLTSFRQTGDGVVASFETPDGNRDVEGSYLLACDGGRSTVRAQLGVPVEGESSDVRCLLVESRSRRGQSARLPLSRLFRRPAGMDDPGAPAALLAFSLSAGRRGSGAGRGRIPRQGDPFHRSGRRDGNPQHHRLSHPPPHRDAMAAGSGVPDGRCRTSDYADVGARP